MLIDVTSYSFLTAITCFSVFIILFSIVRRKNRVVFHCGIVPLICLCILSVARTVCIVEFSFTHVVTINSVNWLYDGMGNRRGFGFRPLVQLDCDGMFVVCIQDRRILAV